MNYDISVNETQKKILQAVLNNDKIIDEKKVGVTGYSLSKGDPKIAMGTWNINYPQLEKNLLIVRTNKDEDTNGRKNKNYSITPIGIFQLHADDENVTEEYLVKIFNCLFIHYRRGDSDEKNIIDENTMKSIRKILQNKNMLEKMQDAFIAVSNSIKIKPYEDLVDIDLTYTLPTTGLNVRIQKIQCTTPNMANIFFSDVEGKTSLVGMKTIDGVELHHLISKFFIYAFVHHVYKYAEFELRSFNKMQTEDHYPPRIKNNLKDVANAEKSVLGSFTPDLLKIVKVFQKNLESEIKSSLQKFKKL